MSNNSAEFINIRDKNVGTRPGSDRSENSGRIAARWPAQQSGTGRPGLTVAQPVPAAGAPARRAWRSEEHTSELQSLMRISYAVLCLKKKSTTHARSQPATTHT